MGATLLGILSTTAEDTPYLVEDLIGGATQNGSGFRGGVEMGGFIYFPATTDELGEELWRTDGTPGGTTELVKDIFPGIDSSEIGGLTVVGSALFFWANDGINGEELWTSDGTPSGTMMVSDIRSGADGSFPRDLHDVNGDLLFTAFEPTNGRELWIHDVSEGTTSLVEDIQPGSQSSLYSDFQQESALYCVLNNKLYFAADDGTHGLELWVSDGTEGGTEMVKDINSGSGDGVTIHLTVMGSKLYFQGNDGSNGNELWCSDGMELGTTELKDINPGSGSGNPSGFAVVGSNLLFVADDGTNGRELWASDGTTLGTNLVKNLRPGSNSPFIGDIIPVGSHAIFEGYDEGAGARVLHRTDGTGPGTTTFGSAPLPSTDAVTALDGNTFVFTRNQTGTIGYELWKGLFTENSIELVKDINPGSQSSLYGQLTRLFKIGTEVYFTASDSNASILDPEGELWKTDGTEGGTVKVADINESPRSGEPTLMATLGNRVLFTTKGVSSFNQRFLYASDGTPDGVVEVKELGIRQHIKNIIPAGDIAYLCVANTDFSIMQYELWKTNGTTAGTVRLHSNIGDYSSNPFDPKPDNFTALGNRLFFATQLDDSGRELWTSNGTPAGTKMVTDLNPGASSSNPGSVVAMGNAVYFRADDGEEGSELWKSNGTPAGTERVKDIYVGLASSNSFPDQLTVVGDTLFFVATFDPPGGDFYTDRELWKSDGTEAGTMQVKNIRPGTDSSFPSQLTAVGNTLFFTANDGTDGVELWKSDGTEGGTVMIEDIITGATSSSPTELTNVEGTLFFVVDDGVHGPELWTSDGTPEGTDLFKDTRPGSTLGDGPQELTAVGSHLFFRSGTDAEGQELWSSDGTPGGTVSYDINPGPAGSGPTEFAHTFNRLLFSATESTTGRELWAIPVTIPVPDNRNPSQRLTSRGGRVKDSAYDLTGSASDNIGVARVEVSLNGGPPVDATLDAPDSRGNVPFHLDGMTLENGINEIVVTTFDLGGNASRSSTLIVNFLSNRPAIAGSYQGLFLPDAAVTPSNDNTGLVIMRVTPTGRFTGRIRLGRFSLPVRGIIGNDGHARFFQRGVRATAQLPIEQGLTRRLNRNTTLDFGTLAFEVDAGLLEGTLNDSTSSDLISDLAGARAHFHPRRMPVPDNYLLNRGNYTAHFPAEATQPGLTADDYPQGTGVGTAKVLRSGRVLTRGWLADGTRFANAATLSETLEIALFAKLYRRDGALAGFVQFDDSQPETDLFGDDLLWICPANPRSKYYPAGWPDGITVPILGAKFQRTPGESVLPGLGPDDFDVDGNAEFIFSDGLLTTPITHTANVDVRNRVRSVPATRDFSGRIIAGNGLMNGVFLHEDGNRTRWRGVVHQKGSMPGGIGFFLSVVPRNAPETGQSGEVVVSPEMTE